MFFTAFQVTELGNVQPRARKSTIERHIKLAFLLVNTGQIHLSQHHEGAVV